MKRPTKRELERALRAPAPEPPPDLARRLGCALPEDLFGPARDVEGVDRFGASATPPGATEGPERDGEAQATAKPLERHVSRSPGRGLAIAASLVAVLGAGWLAVRLLEERSPDTLAPAMALKDRLERPSQAEGVPLASAAPTPPLAWSRPEGDASDGDRAGALLDESARRAEPPQLEERLATGALDAPPARQESGHAGPVRADSERAQTAQAAREDDLVAARSAQTVEPQNARAIEVRNAGIEAQNAKIRELEAEKRRLERGMLTLPGSRAQPPPSEQAPDYASDPHRTEQPRVTWFAEAQQDLARALEERAAESRMLGRGVDAAGSRASRVASRATGSEPAFVDAQSHPVSSLSVVDGPDTLTSFVDEIERAQVPVAALLDRAVAGASGERHEIHLEAVRWRDPRRVFVLLSATLAAREAELPTLDGTDAAAPARAIEVELDPRTTSRYRLLASHAHATAPAGSATSDALAAGSRLYRVAALLELELAADPDADTPIATARLRRAGATGRPTRDAAGEQSAEGRTVTGADLATAWDAGPPELRLTIIGAQLDGLVDHADAGDRRPLLRAELARIAEDPAAPDAVTDEARRLLAMFAP